MDFDQFTAPAAPAASNSMDAFDAAVDDAPAPVRSYYIFFQNSV